MAIVPYKLAVIAGGLPSAPTLPLEVKYIVPKKIYERIIPFDLEYFRDTVYQDSQNLVCQEHPLHAVFDKVYVRGQPRRV